MYRSLTLASLMLLSAFVQAEHSLHIDAKVQPTTNVNRSAVDPIDDTLYTFGAGAGIASEGARHSVELSYSANREIYKDNTIETRTRANGSANFEAFNTTRTVTGFVTNTLTETAFNIFAPDAGENLNRLSTTGAGVTLAARLTSRDTFSLTGGQVWVDSENEALDSTSDMLSAQLTHFLNSKSSIGLIGSHRATAPDEETRDEFEEQRLAVFYSRRLRTGDLYLKTGTAFSDAVLADGDELGEILEYELRYSAGNAITRFNLSAARELASSGLGSFGDGGGSFTPSGSQEFQINIIDSYSMNFNYAITPNKVNLGLSAVKSERENQYDGRFTDIVSSGANLNFNLRSGSIRLNTAQIDREEGITGEAARTQTERSIGINYGSKIGKSFIWGCGADRRDFGSDVISKSVFCNASYEFF